MLLTNLGGVFTGDAAAPITRSETIAIHEGLFTESAGGSGSDGGEHIDVGGAWVMPGLWDGAQHLYFGDHTPTFSAAGALAASVGFGVTTVVAVRPPAVPGAVPKARFQRELAVLGMKSWVHERPNSLHVHTGTVVGHREWDDEDLRDLAGCGAELLLLPAAATPTESLALAKAARDVGLRVGIALDDAGSVDPSELHRVIDEVHPEVATPVNAAAVAPAVIDHLLDQDCALGLVLAADLSVAARVARACVDRAQPHRAYLGSGLPDDRGVLPAALPLLIELLQSTTDLDIGQVIAMASGNVARAFGRRGGVIAAGQPADVVVLRGATSLPWANRPTMTLIDGRLVAAAPGQV